ncbi:hypothetical protein GCM10009841_24890 [Microlunatus panaciterrae]|uniref:Uncharacterized protein n=1 Tax=Microlunatus panaciterrae TaxID=400768 RepID=A0ABS2REE5_9ACTN|nr:hypothetical protein [Microlunatus panaciterrae]MBM7797370.1 hypothetical protein [Microlunatus panaciterrae]
MDVLLKSVDALWRVVLVGLVLGAGLPAVFALGIRAVTAGRPTTADGEVALGRPTRLGLTGAVLAFSLVIAAVAFGIVVIIFGKRLFG